MLDSRFLCLSPARKRFFHVLLGVEARYVGLDVPRAVCLRRARWKPWASFRLAYAQALQTQEPVSFVLAVRRSARRAPLHLRLGQARYELDLWELIRRGDPFLVPNGPYAEETVRDVLPDGTQLCLRLRFRELSRAQAYAIRDTRPE